MRPRDHDVVDPGGSIAHVAGMRQAPLLEPSSPQAAIGQSVPPEQAGLHRIVIVAGGAGRLERATQLGNKRGKRKKAHITLVEKQRTHFWKPHLHEIAAGSMDIGVYETNYLAQAHWHHFRYRIGEMIGLDRQRREVIVAPFVDE